MQQGPSWDPNLNVFGQVWEILGPLPGPVQSECVSRAPLKEAAFCHQVPAGIPTWMSLGRFGKNWASVPTLSNQNGFPELLPGSLTCAAQAPSPDDMFGRNNLEVRTVKLELFLVGGRVCGHSSMEVEGYSFPRMDSQAEGIQH